MAKIITVGGEDFEIGVASPYQISAILKVIKDLVASAQKAVVENDGEMDNLSLVLGLIGGLSEESLITLASASLGSSREFAEEHFNIVWVSDALVSVIEENDIAAVVRNFSRLSGLIAG